MKLLLAQSNYRMKTNEVQARKSSVFHVLTTKTLKLVGEGKILCEEITYIHIQHGYKLSTTYYVFFPFLSLLSSSI
jgi:hypothetical protein